VLIASVSVSGFLDGQFRQALGVRARSGSHLLNDRIDLFLRKR
jgi:hypothetical protein